MILSSKQLKEIENIIGYSFKDRELLDLAFIHKSFSNENPIICSNQNNERLEFLGDSILDMIISHCLYKGMPNSSENELSVVRSRLVDTESCASYILSKSLNQFLLLGRGEESIGGRNKTSLLADLFESVIGAIYLDGGLQETEKFIFDNFSQCMSDLLITKEPNWKSKLQEYCQKLHQKTPIYKVVSETGSSQCKQFEVSVCFFVDDQIKGKGIGSSKKLAEQMAAKDLFNKMV